jgi:formate hydrogenlyase subunit 4
MKYVLIALQSIFLILVTPLFVGILKRMKAFIRGYKGSPIMQPYYDLKRLFSKGMVISTSSSFVSMYGPSIALAFAITVTFLIPAFYTSNTINFGNIFILIFMISVINVITMLIGLDAASTFGGMGSSRESFISLFAEPVMLLVLSVLHFESNTFNLFRMSYELSNKNFSISHFLALAAFSFLILAENARMPVDNPETHLELTMIHEAMILDVSGRNLAFIELASSIKFTVFATLLANLFIPFGIATSITISSIVLSLVLYVIKMLVILFVISVVETTMAKVRLFKVPEFIAASFALSLISVAVLYFNW